MLPALGAASAVVSPRPRLLQAPGLWVLLVSIRSYTLVQLGERGVSGASQGAGRGCQGKGSCWVLGQVPSPCSCPGDFHGSCRSTLLWLPNHCWGPGLSCAGRCSWSHGHLLQRLQGWVVSFALFSSSEVFAGSFALLVSGILLLPSGAVASCRLGGCAGHGGLCPVLGGTLTALLAVYRTVPCCLWPDLIRFSFTHPSWSCSWSQTQRPSGASLLRPFAPLSCKSALRSN